MDIEQQQQHELAQRRKQLSHEADVRWLMSDKRGRAVVRNLLSIGGVYQSSFSVDALAMAFAEGRRQVGLLLLSEVQRLAPDETILMMNEGLSGHDE